MRVCVCVCECHTCPANTAVPPPPPRRFLPPGDKPKRGEWDEAERAHFVRLLHVRPPEGMWGFFSMNMPGRVGSQVMRVLVWALARTPPCHGDSQ